MVKDFKGYREETDRKPRSPGWFILVVSHMAIFIVGISLGYWIGERFAGVTMTQKTVSRKVESGRDKPAESITKEGKTVPNETPRGDETEERSLSLPDRLEKQPRFTFYESLPKETLPGTETSMERGEPEERGSSKAARSTKRGIKTGQKKPAPESAVLVYYVQVASFREEKRARKLRERLRERGYPAEVVSAVIVNKGIWYRVRLGPFADKTEANMRVRAIAKSEKLQPFALAEKREKSP